MPNTATPSPWRIFLPLALVLLLALLWTVYWFVASGMARDRLAAERARLTAQGLTLACTREAWGGYPFHFEFSCSSPILTYREGSELRSQNVLFVALAYAPWQVAVLVDGPTTVTAPGLVATPITHQRALAAVTLDRQGQPSVSAELPAVAIAGLGTADKLMAFTKPASGGGTDIALQASRLTYQPPDKPPVSIDDGSLLGTLQTDRTFKLDKLELNQGKLRYWGAGTLALDVEHRLTGQIDSETNDIKALLAVVGPQIGLSDSKLANLRTMLGLLGNGAKLPIIAKAGVLYIGPFQVAELRPLY